MPLFKRNTRNTPKTSPEATTSQPPAAVQALGAVSLVPHAYIDSSTENRRTTPSSEQIERAKETKKAVGGIYQQYISDAMQKGLTTDQIGTSLIDAWNAGAIPRVVPGMASRAGFSVDILHGEVPADLFTDENENGYAGLVTPPNPERYLAGSVSLLEYAGNMPTQPSPENPDAFYVEVLWLPHSETDGAFTYDGVAAHLDNIARYLPPAQQG